MGLTKVLTWLGVGLGIIGTIVSSIAGSRSQKETIAKEVAKQLSSK